MNKKYYHVSPLLLLKSDKKINFNIYLYNEKRYILYATPANITERHMERLAIIEANNIYTDEEGKVTYDFFVENSLSFVLGNDKINLTKKAKVLYDHSLNIAEKFFKNFKNGCNSQDIEKIVTLVDNMHFFLSCNKNAIQSIRSLISTSYKEYVHCVNTSLYAMSLFSKFHYEKIEFEPLRKSIIRNIGVGAILHDVGKSRIRNEVLEKPGYLTPVEFDEIKKHPVFGIEMCKYMDMEKNVSQCILFHHEKLDGSGYPTCTKNVPLFTQVVTIADMFDAITCDRPYRKHKISSFEAMKILSKEVEKGKINKELVSSFIAMLSQNVHL